MDVFVFAILIRSKTTITKHISIVIVIIVVVGAACRHLLLRLTCQTLSFLTQVSIDSSGVFQVGVRRG